MKPIEYMLQNYRLTTAKIFYRMPDFPSLLQTYVWQELDLVPDFPQLMRFLNFWERKLDGKLHSVMVAHCEVIKPHEIRLVDGKFYLN